MNSSGSTISTSALDSAQARFAQRIAVCLSESAEGIGADVSERLRFARESALQRARVARQLNAAASGLAVDSSGSAVLGGWAGGWGLKAASLVPFAALVVGLLFIQYTQTEAQISVAAEIDADLLADDLPPNAYRDPGFVEFLKLPKD